MSNEQQKTDAIVPADDNLEFEHELAVTAELYVRGTKIGDIAKRLEELRGDGIPVSLSTVNGQIEVIKSRWLQSTLIDYNEAKSRELAKWDALEAEYWKAWQQSLQEQITTEQAHGSEEVVLSSGQVVPAKSTHKKRTRQSSLGNVQYLNGIERCIQSRCKILGLFNADTLHIDWRTEARAFGIMPEEAEAMKETAIQVLMREITKNKDGGNDGSGLNKENDIIEGEFK